MFYLNYIYSSLVSSSSKLYASNSSCDNSGCAALYFSVCSALYAFILSNKLLFIVSNCSFTSLSLSDICTGHSAICITSYPSGNIRMHINISPGNYNFKISEWVVTFSSFYKFMARFTKYGTSISSPRSCPGTSSTSPHLESDAVGWKYAYLVRTILSSDPPKPVLVVNIESPMLFPSIDYPGSPILVSFIEGDVTFFSYSAIVSEISYPSPLLLSGTNAQPRNGTAY